jgi:hypothetical protein
LADFEKLSCVDIVPHMDSPPLRHANHENDRDNMTVHALDFFEPSGLRAGFVNVK